MNEMTAEQAKAILAAVDFLDKLVRLAAILRRKPDDVKTEFDAWCATTTKSAVEAVEFAIREASATGCAPWDEIRYKAFDSARLRDIGDADEEIWSPKKGITKADHLREQVLRCCATCVSLVDLPNMGPPECNRPGGAKFSGARTDALYMVCRKYVRNDETHNDILGFLDVK